jgi:hypothetical protein
VSNVDRYDQIYEQLGALVVVLHRAQVAHTSSYCSQTQRTLELRISAALGQEPEVEVAMVSKHAAPLARVADTWKYDSNR